MLHLLVTSTDRQLNGILHENFETEKKLAGIDEEIED